MPEGTISKEDEESKGYEIELPDGTKRVVMLPLGSLIDPEVFDRSDAKTRYDTLTHLIDACLTETRVKAVETRNNRAAFLPH